MADFGLFFGWNRPVPGREGHAAELFTEVMSFWTKQKELGNCESFEPVFLGNHGGDLNGFLLVRGNQDKLDPLALTDEYLDMVTKSDHVLLGFGVIPCAVGDSIGDTMARWTKHIPH